MQQRNSGKGSTYENAIFFLLQKMQHEQTMLHVSQLRFSLVKQWFVALLHLSSGCRVPSKRSQMNCRVLPGRSN
jgi:hypothetical protein